MLKRILLAILIIGAILGLLAYVFVDGDAGNPSFILARIERGSILSKVSSTGTLSPVITVQVGSQVSGQIKELLADFNEEVRAGQIIARIDPKNFDSKVQEAEAELSVALANVAIKRAALERSRADLENSRAALSASKEQLQKTRVALAHASRDLNRKRGLQKGSLVSESEIDRAKSTYDQELAQLSAGEAEHLAHASVVRARQAGLKMAEGEIVYALAQVKQREASLNQSKINLEHTIIRSPVDGVVIERNVDIGQTVAASLQAPTLFTIAQDLRKMQVDTSVDEADVGRIRVNQEARFTVDAYPKKVFSGRVEQVRNAPQTLQNVVTYTVIVSAENPDLRLLPGMTANVEIVVDERSGVLKMPNAALRFRPPGEGAGPGPGSGSPLPSGREGFAERWKTWTKELGLDQDQQARLQAIFSKGRQKVMALRRQGADSRDIQSEIRSFREQNKGAVLAILTPEQREKYSRIAKERSVNPITAGRVWVLGRDGKPVPVDVMVGATDGSVSEIVKGDLKPGQEVIVGTNQLSGRSSKGRKAFGF